MKLSQIKNPQLLRAVIQLVPRGRIPPRTITAPENLKRADLMTEAERMATFERSVNFHRISSHPPVPNHKALVPCPSPAVTPLAESACSPQAPAADSYLNQ